MHTPQGPDRHRCSLSVPGRCQQACWADRQMWKEGLDAGFLVGSFAKCTVLQAPARTDSVLLSSFTHPHRSENTPLAITAQGSIKSSFLTGTRVHVSCTSVPRFSGGLAGLISTDSLGLYINRQTNKKIRKAESHFSSHLGFTFKSSVTVFEFLQH